MKAATRRRALGRLLAGTAALLGPTASGPAHAAPAGPGEPVRWPPVALLDGTPWAPPAAGEAAVVVFWSMHCPFCRRHNAHLQELYEAARGKPLRVLGVVRERDTAAVQRYLQALGWSFPNTHDTTPMAAALSERRMIPLTVTVDRRGRLLQVLPGEMFEDDLLELRRLTA
jgi:thiol-disulfide isomerase/thioredoxin